jgi:hypothetical protein
MNIKDGKDVPYFNTPGMQEVFAPKMGRAFTEKKLGNMSNGHTVNPFPKATPGRTSSADSQLGRIVQIVKGFFCKIMQNIGLKTRAEQPASTCKISDKKPEGCEKINGLINKILLTEGANHLKVQLETPVAIDKPMATVTDQLKHVVETPMNIDKVMASFRDLKPEGLKQFKSHLITDSLPDLRTKDMRHLLSVGKEHGIENKEEGEIHLALAMEIIGDLFKGYAAHENLDEGGMRVLEGIQGKLRAGGEFARIMEQKYVNGLDDEVLHEAANRLIENIDNSPVIFQLGCEEHCVGIEVERGADNKVHVRISNVGFGRDCLENPEIFLDGDREIYAYIPTYEFSCSDDDIAKDLVLNLMKAFNEEKEPSEMYECFNKIGIDHVRPPDDKVYYRPGQNIGNCVFRNVFEAAYNCLNRNNIDPNRLQEHVLNYAKEAVKNGDVYPELQNAALNVRSPQFFQQKGV